MEDPMVTSVIFIYDLYNGTGRAIAQAVNNWFPTAAVRGSRPGLMWDFVVDKVALG
jgi:hypothetical protein